MTQISGPDSAICFSGGGTKYWAQIQTWQIILICQLQLLTNNNSWANGLFSIIGGLFVNCDSAALNSVWNLSFLLPKPFQGFESDHSAFAFGDYSFDVLIVRAESIRWWINHHIEGIHHHIERIDHHWQITHPKGKPHLAHIMSGAALLSIITTWTRGTCIGTCATPILYDCIGRWYAETKLMANQPIQ